MLEAHLYLVNESGLLSFANLLLKYHENHLTPVRLEVVLMGQILIILLTNSNAQQLIPLKLAFKYKENKRSKTQPMFFDSSNFVLQPALEI